MTQDTFHGIYSVPDCLNRTLKSLKTEPLRYVLNYLNTDIGKQHQIVLLQKPLSGCSCNLIRQLNLDIWYPWMKLSNNTTAKKSIEESYTGMDIFLANYPPYIICLCSKTQQYFPVNHRMDEFTELIIDRKLAILELLYMAFLTNASWLSSFKDMTSKYCQCTASAHKSIKHHNHFPPKNFFIVQNA